MKDRTYREHGEEINQLAWHPTISHQVATASADRLVKIFDTKTDRSSATIETKGLEKQGVWLIFDLSGFCFRRKYQSSLVTRWFNFSSWK